jgi:hypothetical protein
MCLLVCKPGPNAIDVIATDNNGNQGQVTLMVNGGNRAKIIITENSIVQELIGYIPFINEERYLGEE